MKHEERINSIYIGFINKYNRGIHNSSIKTYVIGWLTYNSKKAKRKLKLHKNGFRYFKEVKDELYCCQQVFNGCFIEKNSFNEIREGKILVKTYYSNSRKTKYIVESFTFNDKYIFVRENQVVNLLNDNSGILPYFKQLTNKDVNSAKKTFKELNGRINFLNKLLS